MSVISGVLVKTLEDLKINDFKRFKHNLWSRGPITRQRLEEASVDDTVAMMVQAYCEMNCGSVMSDILRNMHHNQLALNLEKDLQSGGVRLGSPSVSGGAEGASFSAEDSAHCSSSLPPSSYDTQRSDTELLSNAHTTLGCVTTGAELRIVVVGKTGAGKSATGNTILGGDDHFRAQLSPGSGMATCERKTGMVSGRSVIVVDTPGLFDRIVAADAIKREFGKCVEMSMPGPHAFLLVIKLGRSPEEEKNALKWFQENFGPQALRYAIVLFTGADRLKGRPVEDVLPRRADLRDSVHSCQNRYHVINNKEKIDRTQVTGLLEKIEAMVIHNRRTYYTNAMYQEARRRMREEKKMQRQKYEMRIRQEEKKKEQKRAVIQKEIKSAEKWKKCYSVLKDVGAFVEGGVEEEVCAAGLGNALGLLDYVVDDYEDDIKILTKKLSKLK